MADGLSADLLVIGGGITGAGIAQDAAARGIKTVLVDKADFASGTSSRSSKLIHGGLRYLEHFSVGLMRESISERHTWPGSHRAWCAGLPFSSRSIAEKEPLALRVGPVAL